MNSIKLPHSFFCRDVLEVAPDLIGKKIVRIINGSRVERIITEVEAYRGEEDLACHASKGRTKRTEVMYQEGGRIYVYLIYGMHWMLNIVTGKADDPQAVLIRGLLDISGPGKISRALEIDGSFYGESIIDSKRIWIEEGITFPEIRTAARIGVDYAGKYWKEKKWRYMGIWASLTTVNIFLTFFYNNSLIFGF